MITLESVGLVSLGAFISLITVWITKHYEDKRHRREVIMKTALENWKVNSEIVRKIIKATPGSSGELYPLNDFMIYWSIMADVMTRKKITSEELEKAIGKVKEFREIFDKHRKVEAEAEAEAKKLKKTANENKK